MKERYVAESIEGLKAQNELLQRENNALHYSRRVDLARRRSSRHMDRVVDRLFDTAMFLFVASVVLAFATGTI